MSEPFTPATTPHLPLRAAVGMAVIALIAAAGARIMGIPPGPVVESPIRIERDLHFVDHRSTGVGIGAGGIDVVDARTNVKIDELRPGEDGFIRATVRGLARERIRRGIGQEVPFRLALHTDGRLTLEDPTISRTLELEAFGPSNSGAFARFLGATAPANPTTAPRTSARTGASAGPIALQATAP
jgi:putative photosynthetic complex assembly protein